ncbi:hypothetical protein [Pontibacter russatus]|uniref:hypothetical protein n=1 Tax=Pontibacter russatus TaxID=2694929 RepID=UPI00137B1D52|nr:hypothetical protein [Pontibacter russatus]
MYPPNRKPLTKSNTYKNKPKASNSYKKAPAPAKENSLMGMAVVGLIMGAGMAFVSGVKASEQQPTPQPQPNPTPQPQPKPQPTQIPVVSKPGAGGAATYAFVDSWNGEGIYAATSPIYSTLTGNGRNHITQLKDKCFVGLWTGKKQNDMLEMWMRTSAGNEFNYWIAADEVRLLTRAGYDQYIAGEGFGKPAYVVKTIVEYFTR